MQDPGELKEGLFRVLRKNGAVLAGVADLRGIVDGYMTTGVSVAVAVPAHIAAKLQEGPNEEYWHMYSILNSHLNSIVRAGSAYLAANGYASKAVTTDSVKRLDPTTSDFAHKTVAVHAGLGWIGKSNLLVTHDFGGAVRLSSILTSAPLPPDPPATESRCGGCDACVRACPGHAIKNVIWVPGTSRDELYDRRKCVEASVEFGEPGSGEYLCGRCFAVCPYTLRYVRRELGKGKKV